MIIGFDTESSDKLITGLDNYVNPKTMIGLAASDLYVENKVKYIDKLVVLEQTNFVDVIAQYALYLGLCGVIAGIFLGTLLSWHLWIIIIAGIMLLVCLFYLSPYCRFLLLRWRLYYIGHPNKIIFVSNTKIVSRLLLKV